MSMQIVTWGPNTCPDLSSLSGTYTIPFPGTVVSMGFQNLGLATKFCAAQAFVMNARQVFLEVTNTSATSTDYTVYAVVDVESTGSQYQCVRWGPYTCPAFSSCYPTSNFVNPLKGAIVSVGFQNLGLATDFYATQAFVVSDTEAFVQVANYSASSTQWYAWAVVHVQPGMAVDAEPLKGADPEMETVLHEGTSPTG
jgi:hypothetical protein